MNIIPCTEQCIYQYDGGCALERAASCGTTDGSGNKCAHYVEKQKPEAQ